MIVPQSDGNIQSPKGEQPQGKQQKWRIRQ
nr:MAG TPA: hypothetical protein [Caudoviricetes sp.]